MKTLRPCRPFFFVSIATLVAAAGGCGGGDAPADGGADGGRADGGRVDGGRDGGGADDGGVGGGVGDDGGRLDGGSADGGADGGGADSGEPRDAGTAPCSVPADCQDGLFCDGYEACSPGSPGADARGCVAGTSPCPGACDEVAGRCTPAACAAPSCASALECWDGRYCNGTNDCVGGTCTAGTPVVCTAGEVCVETGRGWCVCDSHADCDDGVFCNGAERCASGWCHAGAAPCAGGGVCDEAVDACTCSTMADCNDGLYCSGIEGCNSTTRRCFTLATICPGGTTCLEGRDRCAVACLGDSDCSDGRSCNGNEPCVAGVCDAPLPCGDADGDGHIAQAAGGDDCDDADPTTYPGNPEVCDAVAHDEDCDPTTFGGRDADMDGHVDFTCCNIALGGIAHCGDDCDDFLPSRHAGATEVCNRVDDDCDGLIDESLTVRLYRDSDGDGDGDADCASMVCPAMTGWVGNTDDCDDARRSIRDGSSVCDPGGMGVRTCAAGAWSSAACPAGASCRPQPDGTGLCI